MKLFSAVREPDDFLLSAAYPQEIELYPNLAKFTQTFASNLMLWTINYLLDSTNNQRVATKIQAYIYVLTALINQTHYSSAIFLQALDDFYITRLLNGLNLWELMLPEIKTMFNDLSTKMNFKKEAIYRQKVIMDRKALVEAREKDALINPKVPPISIFMTHLSRIYLRLADTKKELPIRKQKAYFSKLAELNKLQGIQTDNLKKQKKCLKALLKAASTEKAEALESEWIDLRSLDPERSWIWHVMNSILKVFDS